MKNKEFREVYPLVKLSSISWLVAPLVAIVIFILVLVLGKDMDVLQWVVSAVALLGVSSVGVVGFCIGLKKRLDVINSVVKFKNKIAYIIRDTVDEKERAGVRLFINQLSETDWARCVFDKFVDENYDADMSMMKPFIYVYFCGYGKLFIGKRKVHGCQSGRKIHLEWNGVYNTATSLLCHELSHVFMDGISPNSSEAYHHEVMRGLGVDRVTFDYLVENY